MQLQLVAVYLNDSQLEYILTVNTYFSQENFNFNFEYYDSQSDFANRHQVKTYPCFLLLKNGNIAKRVEGKYDFSILREKLLESPYIQILTDAEKKS